MMGMGTLFLEVVDSGVNFTGLGRWCWIHLGSGSKKTHIVMAYQQSNSGRSAGTTIKDQHSRYFPALGDARSPRTIFFEQLVTQLISSKTIDNDIVLLGNFNENVFTGQLAHRLAQDDLNFTEICRRHTGTPIPPTFWTCSAPIIGIFATSGIKCVNVFILPHLGGVGDHCCFIIDLSSESVIGSSFPNIVRCSARKLHCNSKWTTMVYNQELTRLCDEHNMFYCMDVIFRLTSHLTEEDFLLLMNAWDNVFKEYMLQSENNCSKFIMGHIEWSPVIGI
jgi:hypothetical protein